MELTKRSKMYILGFIIFSLVVAVITLGIFVGIYSKNNMEKDRDINGFYQSAYYGLVGNFVDIENDLAKARVMTDGKLLKENLMNIDVNCNLASQNLQVFYANNDGMHNLMSYINQLGDYCVFLIKQLEQGKNLTTSQMENINKLWGVSKEYGKLLNSLQDVAKDGTTFAQLLSANNQQFEDILSGINNGSIEYPSLIYDGPFSDGVIQREAGRRRQPAVGACMLPYMP